MKVKNLLVLSAAATLNSAALAQWTERTVETVRTTEVQVLTSGPVHEAFAETVVYDPEPDVIVLQPPPEPIDEDPPDVVPEGPDITWIPGYWAWDDDRDDYLWVSGIWRSVPPGRRFVPGFWTRIGHGYQWTSGFWVDEDATEIEYLPDPPEPVVEGPPPIAPAPNLIWTPGTWVWDQDRYVWRPGHWVEATPDWVWVPAHYVWGPRGYVFVDGYWDFPIERRGVLFAPVYVNPVVRTRHAFTYAPSVVIDLDLFTDHLFVRPRYRHYYFGDYYAPVYVDRGIYPWFTVQARRVAYDPIYVHRHWQHRHEPDWERRVEARYHHRRDNERERPPRTLDVQVNLGDRAEFGVKGLFVAKTLQQMAKTAQERGVRMRTVDRSERDNYAQKAREISKTREARKEVASKETGASAEPVKRTTPVREKVPASPIAAKKETSSTKAAAPKKPDAPQVDRSVAPQPKAKVERVTRQPSQPTKSTEPSAKPQPDQPTTRPQPSTRPQPAPEKKPEGESSKGKAPEPASKTKKPDNTTDKKPDQKKPDQEQEKSKKDKNKNDNEKDD